MDGYQFEYQCAEILKRNGFSRVQVTQSSGDQGVDIIAHKHRKKYGIQCKYYSYPVGNKAVQEAYAGANFYDCDKAMVMTNLTFTRSATELAQKLEVELWDHCPTTRYYSLLFKLMSLMNIVFFLYGILLLFLLQNKSTVPFSLPGDFLTGTLLVAASVFGFLGWRFVLCNLAAGGIYLYLSLHTVLLPRSTMPLTQIFSFWFCFQLLSICYMPVGLQVTNATESDHIQSMFGAFNGNQQGFTQAWTLSRCLRESKYAI